MIHIKEINTLGGGNSQVNHCGNNLRKIREAEGLTKAELARLTRISDKTISEIESGARRARIETQHQITNGLNTNPKRVHATLYTHEEVFPTNE